MIANSSVVALSVFIVAVLLVSGCRWNDDRFDARSLFICANSLELLRELDAATCRTLHFRFDETTRPEIE